MHGENLPEWVRDFTSALDDRMGFEMIEISPTRISGRLPVAGNTQPAGLLHGGANAVLVETLASMGAWAASREDGLVPVGVDLHVTHLRSVTEGWVTAVGFPIRQGRTVATWQVDITDDRDRLTATGRLTCQLVNPPGRGA